MHFGFCRAVIELKVAVIEGGDDKDERKLDSREERCEGRADDEASGRQDAAQGDVRCNHYYETEVDYR